MALDLEAFKKHLGGPVPAAPASDPDDDGDTHEDGMSPGDQALKAIRSGDAEALEEAIRNCINKAY